MSDTKPLPPPNYTQTPNAIFELMPEMSHCELRVVMAVCRATFGWHKTHDKLSLSQLIERTGLSKQGVIDGAEEAIQRGILEKIPDGQGFQYGILVSNVDTHTEEPVNKVDRTSQQSRQALVNKVDTQKKEVNKEKKEEVQVQEKDLSPTASAGWIIQLHHRTFGMVSNGMLGQKLFEAADEYPRDWIEEAFNIAALANARDVRFVFRTLENWQANGKGVRALNPRSALIIDDKTDASVEAEKKFWATSEGQKRLIEINEEQRRKYDRSYEHYEGTNEND